MNTLFSTIAQYACHQCGRSHTFILACAVIILWAIMGPYFSYSDTWQLVINTSTTIITFLMVFLLQNTQNRDNLALQIKIDELIRVDRKARNLLIDLDHATDEELARLLADLKQTRPKETAPSHHHAVHKA